jgi:hypothetical protein
MKRIVGFPLGVAAGLALGLSLGVAGQGLAREPWSSPADHYLVGWRVLIRGKEACGDPFLRSSEREIECRTAAAP